MSEILPFSEVKARLSELAERIERERDRVAVTRNGRPSFTLIHPDELAALEESVEILQDPTLTASIRKSRREAAAGKAAPRERPA